MSMLAEPRSRQKWSEDPRNNNWASDKTQFGYLMLTKMGWSEGKGLGHTLSGNASHVLVKKRGSNAGVGSKKSHDDNWIAHQDDFNALLNSLNQGSDISTTHKMSSLEDKVKSSKKKILYKRFVKSKDLSGASSQDLACIFGQRNKSTPVTSQGSEDEDASDSSDVSPPETCSSNDLCINTINTGVSVADYFAKKMAALKQTQNLKNNENHSISRVNDEGQKDCSKEEIIKPIKKKGKNKHGEMDDNVSKKKYEKLNIENDNSIVETANIKKKKKRKRHCLENNSEPKVTQINVEESGFHKKKKKKKKQGNDNDKERM